MPSLPSSPNPPPRLSCCCYVEGGGGGHGLTTEEGTPLGFAASASLRRNGEGRAAEPLCHLNRLALLAVNGRESSVGFHRRFAKLSRPAAATSRGGAKTMEKIVGGRGIEDRRRARPATTVVTYRRRRAYECSTSPPPQSPLLRSCSLLVARRSPWLTAVASRGRSRQLAVCDEGLRRRRRRMEAPGSCRGRRGPGRSLHAVVAKLAEPATTPELLLLRRRSRLEEPNHLKVPLCHHCIVVATENSTVATRGGGGGHGLTTEEGTPLGFAASASLRRNGEGRAAEPHRLALLAVNGRESSMGFHRRFAKPSRPAAATSRGGAKTMGKIVGRRGIEDRRRARPATTVVTYRRRRAYECSTSPPPQSSLLRSCSLLVARRSPWLTAAASRGRSRQLAMCDEGLRRRRRRMEAPGSWWCCCCLTRAT
nr:hypothetical protein Iba_chr14cCG4200 [Ipomoea batatas]